MKALLRVTSVVRFRRRIKEKPTAVAGKRIADPNTSTADDEVPDFPLWESEPGGIEVKPPGNASIEVNCQRPLEVSKAKLGDWPACYEVLGEPSSCPMNKIPDLDGISVETDQPPEHSSGSFDMMFPLSVQLVSSSHESRSSSQRTTIPTSSGERGIPTHSNPSLKLDDEGQVILRASERTLIGGDEGRYVVKLVRTSVQQSFGLEFLTAEMRDDGRLSAIFLSDDYPCHGMNRWDRVLSINGVEIRSAADCNQMLQLQLSIVLVLQTKGKQSSQPVPRPDMKWEPPLDYTLITITKVELENDSEFMLWIERRSPLLRLDLQFSAVLSKSVDQPSLFASQDAPHLHVKTGDQLLSVNGVCFPNEVLCGILNTEISLQLKLRRKSRRGVFWAPSYPSSASSSASSSSCSSASSSPSTSSS